MTEDINEIIRKNKGLIYKQLHKFHLVDDDDAVSIAFEALYNAVKTYDQSAGVKLSTYASVCIYNALGCHVRRLKRKSQPETVSYNSLTDEGTELVTFMASNSSVEDTVLTSMRLKAVYNAIQKLSNEYSGNCKKVFDLWCASQFSITTTEIAKQLGVSQPYASTTIARIRADIKKKIGD